VNGPTTRAEFEDLPPPGGGEGDWLSTLAQEMNRPTPVWGQIGAVATDPADLDVARKALLEWSLGIEEQDARKRQLGRDLLHWLLRPALRIRSTKTGIEPDAVADPIWGKWWDSLHDLVGSRSGAVGRIDVVQGGKRMFRFGTGWIAGRDGEDWILVTAGHVLRDLRKAGWGKTGTDAIVDFGCLDEDGQALTLRPVAFGHPDLDLATLRLPVALAPGLQALGISTAPPAPLDGVAAMVVGHPVLGTADPVFVTHTVGFDKCWGVKRASPGLLRSPRISPPSSAYPKDGWRIAFAHDATTLGVSSGSPVFDLEKGTVVGVHVGGSPVDPTCPRWFVDNYAMPGWTVATDDVLHAAVSPC
jgi:hypothetical protein